MRARGRKLGTGCWMLDAGNLALDAGHKDIREVK
jgi:hypothetical protein